MLGEAMCGTAWCTHTIAMYGGHKSATDEAETMSTEPDGHATKNGQQEHALGIEKADAQASNLS